MRTLVIGDIHGCYLEFMELLGQSGLAITDNIIALGDILDRGPDTAAVLNFFQTHPGTQVIMGNHERKHLRSFLGEINPAAGQIMVMEQLGEQFYTKAMNFIAGFPNFLELPEAILVHGLIEPGIALEQQQENILTGTMSGETYFRRKYSQPWYELYDRDKPVIAGHRDYSKTGRPVIYRDLIYLIDTGCCYGRNLTGIILPEYKIISIKSRRNYWSAARQGHRSNHF